MILNPKLQCAIALDEWHFWWPWIPIKMTSIDSHGNHSNRLWGWRWLYVVQRKKIYRDDGRRIFWMRDEYRDIIGRMK